MRKHHARYIRCSCLDGKRLPADIALITFDQDRECLYGSLDTQLQYTYAYYSQGLWSSTFRKWHDILAFKEAAIRSVLSFRLRLSCLSWNSEDFRIYLLRVSFVFRSAFTYNYGWRVGINMAQILLAQPHLGLLSRALF